MSAAHLIQSQRADTFGGAHYAQLGLWVRRTDGQFAFSLETRPDVCRLWPSPRR